MMVMVSNQGNLEFGYLAATKPGWIGHLYSPGGQRGPWPFMPYALDNGAFPLQQKGLPFDVTAWKRLLDWAAMSRVMPLWACSPDLPMNAAETSRLWGIHSPEIRKRGLRPAWAAQNGARFEDVPDDDVVIFMGGDDAWKDPAIVPWCARFPGRVHVGRVNGWDRLVACWRAGAISVDGTGWYHSRQKAALMKFLSEVA